MRNRLVYFALSLTAMLAAMFIQLSPRPAVAQRPSPDDAQAECRACEDSCMAFYTDCTAQAGGRGRAFAQCTRAFEECRHVCNSRGGPCHPQSDAAPTPTPTPSPTPSPPPE